MTYEEVIRKFNNKEVVYSNEITGYQIFRLLLDRIVTTINVHNGDVYEFNFIPVEDDTPSTFIDMNEQYNTYYSIHDVVELIIKEYTANHNIFMRLDNKFFELKVEALETRE